MSNNAEYLENALDAVRSFLARFYAPEEWEDDGHSRAMRAIWDDFRGQWRLARAFDAVLHAELEEGALRDLVLKGANWDFVDDSQAREFLKRVYAGTTLDSAYDPDEFEHPE